MEKGRTFMEKGQDLCGKSVRTLWKRVDRLDLSPSYIDFSPFIRYNLNLVSIDSIYIVKIADPLPTITVL